MSTQEEKKCVFHLALYFKVLGFSSKKTQRSGFQEYMKYTEKSCMLGREIEFLLLLKKTYTFPSCLPHF